jgi:hypothetical protein
MQGAGEGEGEGEGEILGEAVGDGQGVGVGARFGFFVQNIPPPPPRRPAPSWKPLRCVDNEFYGYVSRALSCIRLGAHSPVPLPGPLNAVRMTALATRLSLKGAQSELYCCCIPKSPPPKFQPQTNV